MGLVAMPAGSLIAALRAPEATPPASTHPLDADAGLVMVRKPFTVAEANALIPILEAVIREIARRMEQVQRAAERLQVLDVLWGDRLLATDNPDYGEAESCRRVIGSSMREIEQIVARDIIGRGLRFPQGGLEHGLIDFPTTWRGRWVYLCWKRGEEEISAWHELQAGFAGRRPVTAEHVAGMGRED
jgi:hypothetical protein